MAGKEEKVGTGSTEISRALSDPASAASAGVFTAGTPATTPVSATEQEKARVASEEAGEKAPKDKRPHPEGAEADWLKGAKPTGLQAEPAQFTTNGSLPGNMIPSPSGPIPVGAVARDEEHAKALIEEVRKSNAGRGPIAKDDETEDLPESVVARSSAAELRAIAQSRGFGDDVPEAGARITRRDFLKAQAEHGKKRGAKKAEEKK